MKNKSISFVPLVFVHLIAFMVMGTRKAYAQQEARTLPLHAVAKVYKDSIVIRWAPGGVDAWNMTRHKGYRIFRYDVRSADDAEIYQLNKTPLLPMSHHEIISKYKDKDTLISLLDMAMYGNVDSLAVKPGASFVEKMQAVETSSGLLFMYGMQAADRSAEAANIAGLRWVDKNVQKGGRYIYMITSDTSNANFRIDTAWVVVRNIYNDTPAVPENLLAVSRDKKIELQWGRKQLGNFSTYNIERSDDGGKTWNSLTGRLPYYSPYSPDDEEEAERLKDTTGIKISSILRDFQVYIDSIPENYKEYQYRISGNDAFAETSPYSEIVKAHGVDLTPPETPTIRSYQNIKDNWVKINWNVNTTDGDLMGYYIHRGPTDKGPFEPITEELLDKKTSSFIDTSAYYNGGTYYILMAVDTALNVSTSMPMMAVLVDSIAPSAPVSISGSVDSLGIVRLQWKANPEPDIKGYKVYYSYNKDGVYSQKTGYEINETKYQDTIPLRNMDRKVFYKIVAVDFHNNHSAFSQPATLDRPILIPPTAPRIRQIYIAGEGVLSDWIGSHSEGVAGYEIYRREKNTEWQSITKIRQDDTQAFVYTDTAIRPNTEYFYAAETLDSTGIRSERSDAVAITFTKLTVLDPVTDFNARLDDKENAVKLSWRYNAGDGYLFVVYRSVSDEPLAAWTTLEKDIHALTDFGIDKNKTYRYAIEVRQIDRNIRSERSREVRVEVR